MTREIERMDERIHLDEGESGEMDEDKDYLYQHLTKLEQRIASLEALLSTAQQFFFRYGSHWSGCDFNRGGICRCGFESAYNAIRDVTGAEVKP